MAHWHHRLTRELDNVRAALRWLAQADDVERALRVSGALTMYWYRHGHPAEGRAWLTELLRLPAASSRTSGRAAALVSAGTLAWSQGDIAAADELTGEAVSICRELGNHGGLAHALHAAAFVAFSRGEHDAAYTLAQEARDLARAANDAFLSGYAALILGVAGSELADYPRARAHLEDLLAWSREYGHVHGQAAAHNWLGHIAVATGEHTVARAHCVASMKLRRRLDYPSGVAFTLRAFGNLAAAVGQHARAARLEGAATHIYREFGDSPTLAQLSGNRQRLLAAREALGAPAYDAAFAEGWAMTLEQSVTYALEEDETAGATSTAGQMP